MIDLEAYLDTKEYNFVMIAKGIERTPENISTSLSGQDQNRVACMRPKSRKTSQQPVIHDEQS